MIVQEIQCRSILTRSGIPGVDYALNPYVGCAHGCIYCYATFMKRFTGHAEEWGTFVDVRVNAPDVLRRQIKRAKAGLISFGTVTDAYQPLEQTYGVTRACLKVLVGYDFPVCVLTKSALVLRDLDLIQQLKDVEVAFTINTVDDRLRECFEPGPSPTQARLEALQALAEAGVRTWAFAGPLLPFLSDGEEQIDALFAAFRRAGVGSVLVDSLNLYSAVWGRVKKVLKTYYPDLVPGYEEILADRRPYHEALMERARRIAGRYNLLLRE